MPGWIDVGGQKPTNDIYVLVAFTSQDLDSCCGKPPVRQVGIGQWTEIGHDGGWWVDSKDGAFSEYCSTVTHWMPIPWPYLPEDA